MRYPKLTELKTSRQTVDTFRGYNHNLRIADGEFFHMENMTSDCYPVLSPRKNRGLYASGGSYHGLIAKDSLCYVDGADFVINEYHVPMKLSTKPEDCPKQLISMGAYVIILPDKMWVNTLDTTEYGSIDAEFVSTSDVSFSLCTATGEQYANTTAYPTEPDSPDNMDMWIDTSSTPHSLKQWSESAGMWVTVATTYVKVSATGIGKDFAQYDGVSISGIVKEGLQDLNASMVIWAKGDDWIVVTGIIDEGVTQTAAEGAVTVERRMPEVDFITESENRLWGCRYGVANNGEVVNEIYACKLGDFKNWNCFMGLSTDSYAASCGTDGQFTGAITHLGYPLFFKENCVHKVYGNYPANFQIQTTACRGVQKACERSLAIVNETLFYKAASGICGYDGSLPTEVSYCLGSEAYSEAVGGAHGNKYYVSMKDTNGSRHLFVYDTARGLWHREDDLDPVCFCSCRGEMYAISGGKIITMLGSGTMDKTSVEWMAQTGEIGLTSPDMKYISRLTIRLSMDAFSEITIKARYDFSDVWEDLYTFRSDRLRSFSIPVRPKRCDHMTLRIEGIGPARIYSITKTIEQGSELS